MRQASGPGEEVDGEVEDEGSRGDSQPILEARTDEQILLLGCDVVDRRRFCSVGQNRLEE